MKYDKFFALAKEKGLSGAQIQVSKHKSTAIRLFHRDIDNFSINDSQSIVACGIVNGKFGISRTQEMGRDTFEYLLNGIVESARVNEKEGSADLFRGSEKYHRKNVFSSELAKTDPKDGIALLHRIEDGLYAYDKRITEVDGVEFEKTESLSEFYNSYGLKLKQRSNYFVIVASAVAKQGDEVKTNYDVCLGSELPSFDEKAFVKGIGDKLVSKFGGVQCLSGKYPTVLRNDVFSSLVAYFLESASSDEVQRHSSFLIGKLGQKIASGKLTISEKPLQKNVFFSYFDDEGVATTNKDIIKKGVLTTYLYNRETAKKDGVETTGNGTWAGNKIGIGFGNVVVKGSKKSFSEMVADVKEGVYVTEIDGLGTGMNAQSGDFSCQAQGYMIRDGKIAEPLNLITLSGNLLKMLNDIKGFDNNVKLLPSSIACADVLVKKMSIGGK
jgi:PmbA protein